MWCPHTLIDSAANASSDSTVGLYPKNLRRENVASTSATAPTNGKNIT